MFERLSSLFHRVAGRPHGRQNAAQAAINPARRKQLKLRRVLQQRQEADFYYLIDVVGTCNLRCPSCPVGNYSELPPKGEMSVTTYQQILQKIVRDHPGERIFVDLYNWGEPGLHKHLGEIIRLTRETGYGVGISTNLNVFPDMKETVRASPSYIRISLSGYFNHTYQRTHRRGDINLVKANMHTLRHWIDRLGSDTIVQVGFHVYKSNFPEDFSRMRQLCEELDFIFAPTLAALMPAEKAVKAVDGSSLPGDEEILTNLVISTKDRSALLSKYRSDYPDCQYRQKRTTINFDSSVPLCCATFESKQIIGKNFLELSREEIQARKYKHSFCGKCRRRSLDMLYTGAEPQLAEQVATAVLGSEYAEFLKEWNVSLEPVVEWRGAELSAQEAFELAAQYEAANDTENARTIYELIIVTFPRHGEALFRLGVLAEMRGEKECALEHYRTAARIWPSHDPYLAAIHRLTSDFRK